MFDRAVIEAVKSHAQMAYPNESVGIVVDAGYQFCVNEHEDPRNHFRTYYNAVPPAEILAVVHSHTNGRNYPSREDMEGQIRMAVPWGIVLCQEGRAFDPFFWGDQVPIPPFMLRRFRHGVTDCYALVRDWYRIHRDVLLPNLARDWEWWDSGQDVLEDHFREFGFVEIERADLLPGDCVMGKIYDFGTHRADRVVNHCGVYLGDNQILHHLPGRPSRIDMLGPWAKIITHYLRYQP